MSAFQAACVQMTSTPDLQENMKQAEALIREAAGQGAHFIATPENTDRMRAPNPENIKSALIEADHPCIPFYSSLAKELNIWLLIGSIGIKISDTKRHNRSHLFAPDGKLAAAYNKIHLFDVQLPTGETHQESNAIEPGDKAVIAQTEWGGLGMSICYDLRFAYLYRALAQGGAKILSMPAAFTVPTGKAHWEVLLRARAIETGSFVIAPAQTGTHDGGRKTYGHSMIIGPWGEILTQAGEEPGIISAEINLAAADKARAAIPALRHDRKFGV